MISGPTLHDQVAVRPPADVMTLARMGAFFPTRLSFMRSLIRTLAAEGAQVARPVWNMDANGFGHAVYTVPLGGHEYSLVAFSTLIDPASRTDRVIAQAWDSSYVLFDGVPTAEDITRIEANAPRQEAGRFLSSELILSRANKSIRLFEHVVDSLAQGQQPDAELIGSTGYLMRTTAVYGNGKFGIADRNRLRGRDVIRFPFRLEMLTVWLIRAFTIDLAEHVARERGGDAFVPLDPRLKRHLGVGNSTGLGMAPFLVRHPILINNWMLARETALARVRAIGEPSPAEIAQVRALLARAQQHVNEWNVQDERQSGRISELAAELPSVATLLDALDMTDSPWDALINASSRWSIECQELLVALVIEPYGHLVDGLAKCMDASHRGYVDTAMSLSELRTLVQRDWAWAQGIDFDIPDAKRLFWYVSEEKLEPRLGVRDEDPGAELEEPFDIARQVQYLASDLARIADVSPQGTLPEFLMRFPQHRFTVRRVQTLAEHPYAEIQDNLVGFACLPIDMLRAKLSFFGASKFDPKSDRWTRITMYQGAPSPDELAAAPADADDWWLPTLATPPSP